MYKHTSLVIRKDEEWKQQPELFQMYLFYCIVLCCTVHTLTPHSLYFVSFTCISKQGEEGKGRKKENLWNRDNRAPSTIHPVRNYNMYVCSNKQRVPEPEPEPKPKNPRE